MPKQRKTTEYVPKGVPPIDIFNDYDNGVMFAKNVLARFYGASHINLYAESTWRAVEKSLEVWKAADPSEPWGRIRWGNHPLHTIEVKDKWEFLKKYIQPIVEQGRPIIQEYDQLTRTAFEDAQQAFNEIQPLNRPGAPTKIDPAKVVELRAQGLTQKAIAEQMSVTRQAIAKVEANAETTNSDNITIGCTPKTTERGTSREYLQRRLKSVAPDLLDEVGDGKRFKSVRAAAIEAGILPQSKTFRVTCSTDPQDFALKLHNDLDRDFVVALTAALTELIAGNMED
jgi:DNA-binding XRE family transcriptional regulator